MATTLSYTISDFIPFTKILSADVNSRFNDIKNRLNWAGGTDTTTGLGDDNIQSNDASGGGLTRSSKLKAGTADYAVFNDATGKLTEASSLPTTSGGLGFLPTISTSNSGKVVGVNNAGTALELRVPESAVIIEQLSNNVVTLTSGQTLAINDAVCLDLIDGQYRVMKTDFNYGGRVSSFLGFALNTTTATPQITTLTKAAAWTADSQTVLINGRSYSYAYATSNDASMAALAALLATDQDVQSAVVTDNGSNDNVITITSKGSLTMTITDSQSGAGAPDFTIANSQTASGSSVRVQMFGPLSGFTTTITSNYYLDSSTPGAITAVAPSTIIYVGQAISSSVLFVNPNRFNLNFAQSLLFIKTSGTSGGANAALGASNTEHFNFSSWSAGVDQSTIRSRGGMGEQTYSSKILITGGADAANTPLATSKTYNKTSWSAITDSIVRCAHGAAEYNSKYRFNNGSSTVSYSGGDTSHYGWDGASWSSATGNGFSRSVNGCYANATKMYSIDGINTAGSGAQATYGWNDSSWATETTTPVSIQVGLSARSPSDKGYFANYNGGTTYTFDGSSYSSIGALAYTLSGENGTNAGASCAYNPSSSITYWNGGSSDTSTSIATSNKFNGTTISSETASSTSRSGAMGGII